MGRFGWKSLNRLASRIKNSGPLTIESLKPLPHSKSKAAIWTRSWALETESLQDLSVTTRLLNTIGNLYGWRSQPWKRVSRFLCHAMKLVFGNRPGFVWVTSADSRQLFTARTTCNGLVFQQQGIIGIDAFSATEIGAEYIPILGQLVSTQSLELGYPGAPHSRLAVATLRIHRRIRSQRDQWAESTFVRSHFLYDPNNAVDLSCMQLGLNPAIEREFRRDPAGYTEVPLLSVNRFDSDRQEVDMMQWSVHPVTGRLLDVRCSRQSRLYYSLAHPDEADALDGLANHGEAEGLLR